MVMPRARPPAVSSKLPMRALVALIPSYSGSSPTMPLYLPSTISSEWQWFQGQAQQAVRTHLNRGSSSSLSRLKLPQVGNSVEV